jgi:hypothetical protein
MPLNYQTPLMLNDFTGGLTDYPLTAPLNQYESAQNLLLDRQRNLIERFGSTIYNSTCYQIPAGAQRISYLEMFEDQMLIQSAKKWYYISGTPAWITLQGVDGNDVFDAGTVSSLIDSTQWRGHLIVTNDAWATPTKIYKDSTTLKVLTAGLPKPTAPTVTPQANDAKAYIYAFVYYNEYTVGSSTFIDISTPVEVVVGSAGDMSGTGHFNAITAIPAISALKNYNTLTTKIHIYRTIHNGDKFFYVGSVNSGTTTYTDNSTDATIILNAELYTDTLEANDTPPVCKYLATANDIVWYGHVKDGTQIYPFRIRQSIQGDPDSCPASFYTDVDGNITGLAGYNNLLICMTEDKIFRIEGYYTDAGQIQLPQDYNYTGVISQRMINDKAGCISHLSIVETIGGVFWAGNDGFYWSDGMQVKCISDNIRETYKTITSSATQKLKIYGTYDNINQRIYWSVTTSSENNEIFVYDLFYGCFTGPLLGGNSSFNPTAILVENGSLVRADSSGYLFKHTSTYLTDPVINLATNPSTWKTQAIIYNLKTVAINFGSDTVRKWVPKIKAVLQNEGNIAVQINSYDDGGVASKALQEIRYMGSAEWEDPELIWEDDSFIYPPLGTLITKLRRFPTGKLRCFYKQIEITNAMTVISYSDLTSNVTINNVAKTATLVNAADYDMPASPEGYYIRFSDDDYTREYLITAGSGDVVTFADTGNYAPSGVYGYEIVGCRKNDYFHLVSLTLDYAYMSDKGAQYVKSTDETGNA